MSVEYTVSNTGENIESDVENRNRLLASRSNYADEELAICPQTTLQAGNVLENLLAGGVNLQQPRG